MMYLLTMGWFLAHTSLAMTPEHSATNGENSSLRSARAGHSKSMCLSSPKAPEPTHTPVARQAQMAALLNWQQMRPHAKPQNPLQLCSAHGDFPVDWADLMCRTRKTSGDTCTASPPGQGKIWGLRAQHQRLPAVASEKTVAAHQAAPQQEHRPPTGWTCHAQQST